MKNNPLLAILSDVLANTTKKNTSKYSFDSWYYVSTHSFLEAGLQKEKLRNLEKLGIISNFIMRIYSKNSTSNPPEIYITCKVDVKKAKDNYAYLLKKEKL